jgi:uncharacterized protein (DUF433 family)
MINHALLTAVRFDLTTGKPVLRDTGVSLPDIYDAIKGGMRAPELIAKWPALLQTDVDAVYELCAWEDYQDAINNGTEVCYSVPVLLSLVAFVGHNHMVMPFNLVWLAGHIAEHPDHELAMPTLHDMITETEKYDHHARLTALRALRLIGGTRQESAVIKRATELLRSDNVSAVRYEAVRVLADAGQADVTPAILSALDNASQTDEDSKLRAYAAEAAAKLRGVEPQ